jgi:hypothetical protein
MGKSRDPQKDGVTNIEVPKGDKNSRSHVRLQSGDGAPQGWRNMCATWRNRWVPGSGDSVAKEWRNRVLRFLSPFALPSVACPLSLPSRLFSLSLPRPSWLSLLCPITPKNPRACAHLDCVLTSGTHPSFRPFL